MPSIHGLRADRLRSQRCALMQIRVEKTTLKYLMPHVETAAVDASDAHRIRLAWGSKSQHILAPDSSTLQFTILFFIPGLESVTVIITTVLRSWVGVLSTRFHNIIQNIIELHCKRGKPKLFIEQREILSNESFSFPPRHLNAHVEFSKWYMVLKTNIRNKNDANGLWPRPHIRRPSPESPNSYIVTSPNQL